ncbi:hypothetical protein JCM3770_004879 [Rhodotorula araucariae]
MMGTLFGMGAAGTGAAAGAGAAPAPNAGVNADANAVPAFTFGTGTGAPFAPAAADDSTDDDMPPLETIPSPASATPAAPASSAMTSRPAAPATNPFSPSQPYPGAADGGDDDDMPPLESIDGAAVPPAPSTATARARGGHLDDDEMPALEPVGGNVPSGLGERQAQEQASAVLGSLLAGRRDWEGAEDEDNSEADDEDWDSEEDEDDWEGAEDEDGDEEAVEDSDADDERIYSDGLPKDPLLPLLFINRPFLHATRRKLYRSIVIDTPYVASLVHRALAAPTPAGWVKGEEGGASGGYASLGRGGGEHYIALMRLCRYVETLIVRPMFFKTATYALPFSPSRCSRRSPGSRGSRPSTSSRPKKPFKVTTPRLFKLMQQSWPDLESLIVANLKPAGDGPSDEEDEMWDLVEELEQGDWERSQAKSRAKDGDADEDDNAIDKGKNQANGSDVLIGDKPKRRGLKSLVLAGFNITGSEMDLLLQDSADTLKSLMLIRPGYLYGRFELASTLLHFGHKLTYLELLLPANWDPSPKVVAGIPKPVYPVRPKDYIVGKPTHEHLKKISSYTYLLDAVMPYLPNLKNLRFEGPYASTSVFSFFPPTLTHISYGNCPEIKPQPLAKLLNKTVTRQKTVTQADGSKTNKTFNCKPARGLICLTVLTDDLAWNDADITALENATSDRDICLHLSGDGAGAGARFIPLLGGIGGIAGIHLAGGVGVGGAGHGAGVGGRAGAGAGAVPQAAGAAIPRADAAAPVPTRAPAPAPAPARAAVPAPTPAAAPAPLRPAPTPGPGAAAATNDDANRPNPRPVRAGFGGLTGLAGRWATR